MLQVTLTQLSLAANSQETIKNQINASLDVPELSPLERYAYANVINKAAADATKELSDAGIQFALENCQPDAGLGRQFEYKGLRFGIQYTNEYNYNQGDENGRKWAEVVKQIEDLEVTKKALTKQKKGIEAMVLAEHPRLQPVKTSVVLKFIPAKL